MWVVYLELFGIPMAVFGWVLYGLIIKKKPWTEIQPAVFVSAVWALVYFVLLG